MGLLQAGSAVSARSVFFLVVLRESLSPSGDTRGLHRAVTWWPGSNLGKP